VLYLSERYGFTALDGDGSPVLAWLAPQVLANLYGTYDNVLVRASTWAWAAYNLFNARQPPAPGLPG
jgi:hypothetical protein